MVEILSAPSDLESKYIPGSRLTTETEFLDHGACYFGFHVVTLRAYRHGPQMALLSVHLPVRRHR